MCHMGWKINPRLSGNKWHKLVEIKWDRTDRQRYKPRQNKSELRAVQSIKPHITWLLQNEQFISIDSDHNSSKLLLVCPRRQLTYDWLHINLVLSTNTRWLPLILTMAIHSLYINWRLVKSMLPNKHDSCPMISQFLSYCVI